MLKPVGNGFEKVSVYLKVHRRQYEKTPEANLSARKIGFSMPISTTSGQVKPSDLARRINVRPQGVNRPTDLHPPTHIHTISQALPAIGRRLELSFD